MKCKGEAGWEMGLQRGQEDKRGNVIKIKEVLQSHMEINYLQTKVKTVYIDYMEILSEL